MRSVQSVLGRRAQGRAAGDAGGGRSGAAVVSGAVILMLLGIWLPARAEAGKYSVLQCGWGIGHEASWAETASDRFGKMSPCVGSSSSSWDGVLMRTYSRPVARSAAATRFGRWRWSAPSGTRITNVRGTWWHELRSGFQHRLGGISSSGAFKRTHTAKSTSGMRSFAAGFSPGVAAFESRLLCARVGTNRCDTGPSSHASIRALTITLEDRSSPDVDVSGSVLGGGWLRGKKRLRHENRDEGAGLREAETSIDGREIATSRHTCHEIEAGGETHGRLLRPCGLYAPGYQSVNTTDLKDGSHDLVHCAEDFAGNTGCSGTRRFKVDNNAPTAPVALRVTGGEDWRRDNGFELTWRNPSSGGGSPIAASRHKVTGPDGYEGVATTTKGKDREEVAGIRVPKAGEYEIRVWLRDEAGNEDRGNDADVTVRLDDIAPSLSFDPIDGGGIPEQAVARLRDEHSGPDGGAVFYRKAGSGKWRRLPASVGEGSGGVQTVTAALPVDSLDPGRYELRATGADAAGNRVSTTRTEAGALAFFVIPPKEETRIEAELVSGPEGGRSLTLSGPAEVAVAGRLTGENGRPVRGAELRVTVQPGEGSLLEVARDSVKTDAAGGFYAPVGLTTSGSVSVSYSGTRRLEDSRSADLELEVKGSLRIIVRPDRVRTGRMVAFHGKVHSGDGVIPPEGKLVTLQYLEREHRRWQPIGTARTNSVGRFRMPYRFRFITRPTAIRVRALAPAEGLWPFAAGASRPVVVRVLPRRPRASHRGPRRTRRGLEGRRRPGIGRRGAGRGRRGARHGRSRPGTRVRGAGRGRRGQARDPNRLGRHGRAGTGPRARSRSR